MNPIDFVRRGLIREARRTTMNHNPFKFPKSQPFAKANRDAKANRLKEHGHKVIMATTEKNYLIFVDGLKGD